MKETIQLRTTMQTLYALLRQQRLAWSCAAVVGLFLVLVGHAPTVPVFTGCVLAVALSLLRSWHRGSVHHLRRSTK
jgi:hypothetical protein